MISFSCSRCGLRFRVKDEFAGRSSKCPACQEPLVVPQPRPLQPTVPSGRIEGTASVLDQAGVGEGVALPPSRPVPPGRLPVPPGPKAAPEPQEKPVPEAAVGKPAPHGRYVLEGEIARGGMGAVLRGVDRDIRREVAIKFMLDDLDPRKKARFIEEAQITGQLEHPNIVPVHELGIDGQKRLFFTMKMVRGRSLAQVLEALENDPAAAKEWSLGRLLNVLVNVCHALGYAHSRGVVHRDLKPANIMVGDFGEVYVMDWGLAKVLRATGTTAGPAASSGAARPATGPVVQTKEPSGLRSASPAGAPSDGGTRQVVTNREAGTDLTQDGAILGTPAYMPPEQASGEVNAVDQRSDIYSLGAILYALLTLQAPVETGGDYIALILRVVEGAVKRPEQRAPERARQGLIPRELSAIAMKALAREREDRYQTVDAFRRDLELFLEGRSVSAKEDTAWEMLTKFVKRNRGFSAATGMALVVLVVVVSFFLRINYAARLHAEKQEKIAVRAKEDFETSQKEKDRTVRESLPAFVGAARQLSNDGQIGDAEKQIEVAIAYDPGNQAAHLLKGQIFVSRREWARAQGELSEYLRQQPDDEEVRSLVRLIRQDTKDPAVLFGIAESLQRQKLNGLAANLFKDVENTVATRMPLLRLYQKQIDAAWPGLGKRLALEANGQFTLLLDNEPRLVTLQPLHGMNLHKLRISGCPNIAGLEPLTGMPLTVLGLVGHPNGNRRIGDLKALEGMPLSELTLQNLPGPVDLEPLRNLPLTKLIITTCPVADLRPLEGLRLSELQASNSLTVSNLEPLRRTALRRLNVSFTGVQDLTPIKRMPLQYLNLGGCRGVKNIDPIQGMPLIELHIEATGVQDLAPLNGMKLETLAFTPTNTQKNLGVLRQMQSVKTVIVERDRAYRTYPVDEFWKRHAAGEFGK